MKISKNGFEFECANIEEAKSIINLFTFGKAAREVAVPNETTSAIRRYRKKGQWTKWTVEEMETLVRLFQSGVDSIQIERSPALTNHNKNAIYVKIWELKNGLPNVSKTWRDVAGRMGIRVGEAARTVVNNTVLNELI